MNISKFGSKMAGKLMLINEKHHAFIPDPLPPEWQFPLMLWPTLAEAKAKVSLLEGVGRTLPNPGLLLQPLAQREAIQSSRLEGTYVTPTELFLYEMEPHPERPGEGKANEWREVFNYRKALDNAISSELPLSLRLIREMHRTLLSGVRGKEKAPGEFRRVQVAIGANSRFVPPPPGELSGCLDSLEKYLHKTTSYDPLIDCFLTHYQFETIHPFMDGNGRVGRLLLALMVQNKGGLTKPWLYMSEFFEKNREEYCQRLFNVSAEGDWGAWIEFCLRGATGQAEGTVKRCDKIRSIRDSYLQKLLEVGGSVRLNQIVEDLFRSPFVRVGDVAKKVGVTYPTAKADIDRLVKAGILRELKKISPKTFYAPDIYDAAYRDIEEVE